MIRPLPSQLPSHLPSARKYPDPQHFEDLSRLGDEITELAAHLAAGTCQLLELIHIFDEEGGWHGPGIASCAHWLNWKCSMSLGTARERVRVAHALPALPKILAAFRSGQVSYSKVRAMTRAATWRNEEVLLNVALHGTAAHVETQVRLYRKVKRIEAFEQGELQHARRKLSLYQDDDGSWVINGRLSPEQGALIAKALPHAFESRHADALERMAESFLAATGGESSGGDRYLINIHTDIETLTEGGSGAESEIEDRGHVSAETSRL